MLFVCFWTAFIQPDAVARTMISFFGPRWCVNCYSANRCFSSTDISSGFTHSRDNAILVIKWFIVSSTFIPYTLYIILIKKRINHVLSILRNPLYFRRCDSYRGTLSPSNFPKSLYVFSDILLLSFALFPSLFPLLLHVPISTSYLTLFRSAPLSLSSSDVCLRDSLFDNALNNSFHMTCDNDKLTAAFIRHRWI